MNYKEKWVEGYFDEWIFVYSPSMKLLLIEYANGEYDNIYNRIVQNENDEKFTSKAPKKVRNVATSEMLTAVAEVVAKDDDYMFVDLDWSNKKDVYEFINS